MTTNDTVPSGLEELRFWLRSCLGVEEPQLKKFNHIKQSEGREVWEVSTHAEGRAHDYVLSIFKPANVASVNTNLEPGDAARKCFLCCSELPGHGITTPRPVGWADEAGMGALLTERVFAMAWAPSVTRVAAALLARLHTLEVNNLSAELRALVARSDPREERTTGGRAPESEERVLVHGDYFSANILPARDGLRVVDWETFGLGDPMWDLGTLLGADRELQDEEVDAAIAAYGEVAPLNLDRLNWHRENWVQFFAERDRR